MKKVLFVATVVKGHIAKFHIPYLNMFQQAGWETAVAARNDYEDPADCEVPFCHTYYDIPFERSPYKFSNLKAFLKLKRIIKRGRYDIIHCHTPVGAMLTRLAAMGARKHGTKMIYTAHGFHFYKGAPLLNWLLYFPVEWVLAHLTDVLIVINQEDYMRARRFGARKVCYVPGVGLDFTKFNFSFSMEERKNKREEMGVPEQAKLLVSVGELNRNKNHEVVIRALAKLQNSGIHYCIAGSGELDEYLTSLADRLGVERQVHLLGFRSDVAQIYKAADICCFPSVREGLGMAVLEGIVCGLPVIAANNRGVRDIISDGESGILCLADDVDAFAAAIQKVIARPDLAAEMNTRAKEKARQFSLENARNVMRNIYQL